MIESPRFHHRPAAAPGQRGGCSGPAPMCAGPAGHWGRGLVWPRHALTRRLERPLQGLQCAARTLRDPAWGSAFRAGEGAAGTWGPWRGVPGRVSGAAEVSEQGSDLGGLHQPGRQRAGRACEDGPGGTGVGTGGPESTWKTSVFSDTPTPRCSLATHLRQDGKGGLTRGPPAS